MSPVRFVARDQPAQVLDPPRGHGATDLGYARTFNLAETLLYANGAADSRPAILYDDESISYGDLRRRVPAIAAVLARLGVEAGTPVALRMPNRPDFVLAWLAIQWLGAIAVPIPPLYRRREIARIVEDSGVRFVICAEDLTAEVDAARQRTSRELVAITRLEQAAASVPPRTTAADEPAAITYIAASDRPLRGVVHSPADFLASADTYGREVLELNGADVCIGNPALSWAYGLGALLVFPLRFGATTALAGGVGGTLPSAIAACRATIMFGVPTLYRVLLQQPDFDAASLRSLRLAISAAEPLPQVVADDWRERTNVDLLNGLGTTELCHIVISTRAGDRPDAALGRPVTGYEARIVDDRLELQPPGRIGLLAVRGPTGCRYWRDPDAQRRAVRDGWTLTGDICAADEDGYIRHVRRADDLIVSGGCKIAPREVESVLHSHPAVARAEVFGVPDPIRGAVPHARVVLRAGSAPLAADAIQQYLKNELAPYKCPRQIQVE